MSGWKWSTAVAVTVATLALLLELHLRRKDIDRRTAVDASLYLIDNDFCKETVSFFLPNF
jgi:hypothetical protein